MSVDLNKLWFLSLEIEGLISILRDKDEKEVNDALPLLKEKVACLSDVLASVSTCENETSETEVDQVHVMNDEPVEPPVEVEIAIGDETLCENAGNADEIRYVEYPKQIIVIRSETTTENKSDTGADSNVGAIEPAPEMTDDEKIAETAEFEEKEDAGLPVTGDVAKEPVAEEIKTEPIRVDKKLSRSVARDIKRAFTINDKFLFRRELFGNSNQQYNDALDLIAQMTSFAEAESYFFGNYGWDTENGHVKRFMEIIENYFES